MKNFLIISALFLSIFTATANESVGRTYIVNEDGTVTFLNKVAPNTDETGRTYIVEEDGTVTFLDRVAPSDFEMSLLEEARSEITNVLNQLR
jgi:hypothetical protein